MGLLKSAIICIKVFAKETRNVCINMHNYSKSVQFKSVGYGSLYNTRKDIDNRKQFERLQEWAAEKGISIKPSESYLLHGLISEGKIKVK